MNKRIKNIMLIGTLLFAPTVAKAETSFEIVGNNTIYPNESTVLSVIAKNDSENVINALNGIISVSDNECINITNIEAFNNTLTSKGKFIGAYMDGLSNNTEILKVTITSNNNICNSSIDITGGKIAFMNGTSVKTSLNNVINVVAKEEVKAVEKKNDVKAVSKITKKETKKVETKVEDKTQEVTNKASEFLKKHSNLMIINSILKAKIFK